MSRGENDCMDRRLVTHTPLDNAPRNVYGVKRKVYSRTESVREPPYAFWVVYSSGDKHMDVALQGEDWGQGVSNLMVLSFRSLL